MMASWPSTETFSSRRAGGNCAQRSDILRRRSSVTEYIHGPFGCATTR